MMKILVTGGLGFIGSNFILRLMEKYDFEITNIDAEFYGSNQKNLEEVKRLPNYKFVRGNITDNHLMTKLISNSDIIVNFAAESFVDRSISDAEPFLTSNVKGVFTILEIIKSQKKKLIHISTDEVYGSLNSGTAVENSRFNPSSPYAATKASAELLVNSYISTYDCDCIITRCTNNYGPRQFPEKLIPKTILLASQNKNIPVYGTGKNIRDWIFVRDHCDAIIQVMLEGKSGQSYNISANNEVDNLTIIKKILSMMNKPQELIEFVEDRPGHDLRYSMDSTKIRQELKWSTSTTFSDGIKYTVDWYMSQKNWWENIPISALSSTPWKN